MARRNGQRTGISAEHRFAERRRIAARSALSNSNTRSGLQPLRGSTMGHLPHYTIDSCLRRRDGRGGRFWLGVGEFGPDQMPVVWAQITARDQTAKKQFDRHAPHHRDRPDAIQPLRDGRRTHTEMSSQISSSPLLVYKRSFKNVHGAMIRHCLSKMQGIALFAAFGGH